MIDWAKPQALRHRQPLDAAADRVLPLKNNLVALAENPLNHEIHDTPHEFELGCQQKLIQLLFGQLIGWAEGDFFFIIIQNNLI
jgi:hypothetical protein